MYAAVFHNSMAAGRGQRSASFERGREVDQRGPYPRCTRRQVILILFRLHQASHTSPAAWGTNSRAGRVRSALLHLSPILN